MLENVWFALKAQNAVCVWMEMIIKCVGYVVIQSRLSIEKWNEPWYKACGWCWWQWYDLESVWCLNAVLFFFCSTLFFCHLRNYMLSPNWLCFFLGTNAFLQYTHFDSLFLYTNCNFSWMYGRISFCHFFTLIDDVFFSLLFCLCIFA